MTRRWYEMTTKQAIEYIAQYSAESAALEVKASLARRDAYAASDAAWRKDAAQAAESRSYGDHRYTTGTDDDNADE